MGPGNIIAYPRDATPAYQNPANPVIPKKSWSQERHAIQNAAIKIEIAIGMNFVNLLIADIRQDLIVYSKTIVACRPLHSTFNHLLKEQKDL